MAEPITEKKHVNGLDTQAFFATLDNIRQDPELAKCHFRLENRWIDGGHNQSTIRGFYAARQEIEHENTFTLDADEPPLLLGRDLGPNPAEYLLGALAACVTTSLVYHAAAKGVQIEEVRSELEGDLDLRGFLGIDPNVRNGYQTVRMKLKVKADVSDEVLQEILESGPKYSPVFDSVTQGISVEVSGERL